MRDRFVSCAVSFLDATTGDQKHREIINIYNSFLPHPRGYKMTYTASWCAAFVSAVGIKCEMTDIIPVECSCNEQIALLQSAGAWEESDAHTPQKGDLVYYDWQDTGKSDNRGWADHVGIVETVGISSFRVIEGNKGGKVAYRTMPLNGRYIRGFGVPKFEQHAANWCKKNGITGTPEEMLFKLYQKIKGEM